MRYTDKITAPNKVVGNTNPVVLGTIPKTACNGTVNFVKETTLDEVYITFGSEDPSPTKFDIKLTDNFPVYTEEFILPGEIRALGSLVTSKLSTFVPYC